MKILSVGKGRTVPVLLLASREDGAAPCRYVLSTGEYEALGSPEAGTLLTEEEAEALCLYDERHRAVQAAGRILEFGDNTPARLLQKLRVRGFSADAAARAVAKMVERGYIREADQLERAVQAAGRKLWGPRRITEALAARGFDRGAIAACIDRLCEAGELDFAAARQRLLAEKLPADMPPEKRRAYLYRYGYGGGDL